MAQPETFSDIKDVLNTILDDTGTTFYTTADRDMAVNAAHHYLFNLAASLGDGMGLSAKEATLTVTSGSETLGGVPSDLYKVVAIYYKDTETKSYNWMPTTPVDMHQARRVLSRGSKQLAYYLRGTDIVAVPTPSWTDSANLKIAYIGYPTEMTSDTDQPSAIPLTHRELLAYEAAKRLKEKEGVPLGRDAQEVYQRLLQAFERDMETRTGQRSRRLSGSSGYHMFDPRVF